MAVIEVGGVLVGVGGLAFGAYQYLRARNDKKRKNEFNELADELNELRGNLEDIVETFNYPEEKVDLSRQLSFCAKDILAYKHETGDNALVKPSKGGEEKINNAAQALDLYKNSDDKPRYHISLESGYTGYESDLIYAISDHSYKINNIYDILERLQGKHKGTLEEFSPGLYQKIESSIDDFVQGVYSQILNNQEGTEIDPDEFEDVQAISRFLFEYFWYYEDIDEDLNTLSELSEDVEEIRTTILQATY